MSGFPTFKFSKLLDRVGKRGVDTSSNIMITTQGINRADNNAYNGTKSRILVHINDNKQSVLVHDLAFELRLPLDHVKDMVNILVQRGDLQVMGV